MYLYEVLRYRQSKSANETEWSNLIVTILLIDILKVVNYPQRSSAWRSYTTPTQLILQILKKNNS